MSDGSTTHYGWVTPQVNGSINTWGTKLNNNLNQLDSTLWSVSGGITAGYNAPSASASNITLTNPMVSYNSLAYTAGSLTTIMPAMNTNTSPQVGSMLKLYNSGSFGFRVLAQDGSTAIFGTGIATGTITSAGSVYTNGYYVDVPLTGGTGTGARANITVSGAVVSGVWMTNRGTGYIVGDNLSALAANIGGTGSGFTFQVATLTNLTPGATLIMTPTSNASANGAFNSVVQGDVFSQNNGADFADINATLNTLLPQQGGMSGLVLTTNGTNTTWSSGVPTGMVVQFPVSSAPALYHELNGALLSRTTYATLWAFAQASGNIVADGSWDYGMFSTGDGSTTFRIPDWRGYSSRGWDDGRGIDTGRTIGSSQADAIASHNLAVSDPTHTHATTAYGIVVGSGSGAGNPGITPASISPASTGIAVSYNGASETRAKNIAVMFCIKT